MAFALGPLALRPRVSPGLPFQCAFPTDIQRARSGEMDCRFPSIAYRLHFAVQPRDMVGFPPCEQRYEPDRMLCAQPSRLTFHPSQWLKRQAQSTPISLPSENIETDASVPTRHAPGLHTNTVRPQDCQFTSSSPFPQSIQAQRAVPCHCKSNHAAVSTARTKHQGTHHSCLHSRQDGRPPVQKWFNSQSQRAWFFRSLFLFFQFSWNEVQYGASRKKQNGIFPASCAAPLRHLAAMPPLARKVRCFLSGQRNSSLRVSGAETRDRAHRTRQSTSYKRNIRPVSGDQPLPSKTVPSCSQVQILLSPPLPLTQPAASSARQESDGRHRIQAPICSKLCAINSTTFWKTRQWAGPPQT